MKRRKPSGPPSSGLIDIVVDDVVAVRRAGPRGEDRRGVEVADAEPRQMGHDRGRVVEGEVLVELHPVGGPRRRRRERARRAAKRPRPSSASAAASRASSPPGPASAPTRRRGGGANSGEPTSEPGRFAWFSSPAASSNWMPTRAEGVRARIAHHRPRGAAPRAGRSARGSSAASASVNCSTLGAPRRAFRVGEAAVEQAEAFRAGRCRGRATSRGRSADRASRKVARAERG